MAETRVTIRVDADTSQATRAADQLADKFKNIGEVGRGAGAFDPMMAARRRVEQAARTRETERALNQLDPTLINRSRFGTNVEDIQMVAAERVRRQMYEREVRAEMGRQQPGGRGGFFQGIQAGPGNFQLYESRLLSQTLTLVGLQSMAAGLEGLGQGLEDLSGRVTTATDAVGTMGREFLKHIPILGHVTRGLELFGTAVSGRAAERQFGAQFLAGALPEIGLQGGIRQMRFRAGEQVFGLERAAGDAATRRLAAEGMLAEFGPRAASFRPEVQAGVTTAQTGALRFAEFQARGELRAARDVAADRGVEFRDALRARGLTAQRAAGLQGELDALRRRREGLVMPGADEEIGAANFFAAGDGPLGRRRRREGELEQVERDLAAKQAQLLQARRDQEDAVNRVIERRQALQKAELDVAQKQLDVGRAREAVMRDQLAVVQEQIGGMAQMGLSPVGTTDRMLAALRQAENAGVQTLSPEDLALLQANPLTRDVIGRLGLRRAEADPAARQVAAEARRIGEMLPPGGLEAERNRLQDAVNAAFLENNRQFAKAIEDSLKTGLADLSKLIVEAVNVQIEAAIAELRKQQAERAVQGQQQR